VLSVCDRQTVLSPSPLSLHRRCATSTSPVSPPWWRHVPTRTLLTQTMRHVCTMRRGPTSSTYCCCYFEGRGPLSTDRTRWAPWH